MSGALDASWQPEMGVDRRMGHEILTPREMAEADRLTIEGGRFSGYRLMLNAGDAIARHVLAHHGGAAEVHILCGPGNNGGDGYVVARLLARRGVPVHLWALAEPSIGTDAARARADCLADCPLDPRPLQAFQPPRSGLIIDALFGAGLNRPLSGAAAQAIARANGAACTRIAVDVPSGLDGLTGQPLGAVFAAHATISFFRKKPGHLLYPGRQLCGQLIIADIGIGAETLAAMGPNCFENAPPLWVAQLPRPQAETHKYRRGHVGVLSGGAWSTGAARLAAMAAARSGAGAVTVLSPTDAMASNAAHLTSIMLHECNDAAGLQSFIEGRKVSACVLGPGFGVGDKARAFGRALLELETPALVFDADAITAFKGEPQALRRHGGDLVLTPHEGEFARLYPGITAGNTPSKLERARKAAEIAGATIVYKGADTVIAAPDGRAAINSNGTPLLATAGSGDVLAGLIAGLMGQAMPGFEAACAAVHIHAAAARHLGHGLIAEDLPAALGPIIGRMIDHAEA